MGTIILGRILSIIKPLWIWGLVASSLVDLPTSFGVKKSIEKNDPSFVEYLENRTTFSKVTHLLKSAAKMLIPFINIAYPFILITKLIHLGFKGLSENYKQKIYDIDYKKSRRKTALENVKTKFNEIKEKIITKQNERIKPAVKKENIVTPVVTKTTPVVNKPVVKEQPKKSVVVPTKINSSNISKEEMLKKEYWNVRHEYDRLKSEGKDVTEVYNKLLIIYDKIKSLKDEKENNRGPVMVRK